MSPWFKPNVFGEIATNATPIATTAAVASRIGLAFQRIAPSTPSPTSSAPRLERDNVSTSPAHSNVRAPTATSWSRSRRPYRRTAASRIITNARNLPKMSGSKNTELIAKYVWTLFSAISLGLSSNVFVAYSTNPISTNTSAKPTTTSRHRRRSSRDQRSLRSRHGLPAVCGLLVADHARQGAGDLHRLAEQRVTAYSQ